MKKALLFMPTITGSIPNEMVNILMKLNNWDIQVSFMTTTRLLIHSARNLAIQKTIEWWYDYLIFLDDDNPPKQLDFIPRMIKHWKDIVVWVVRQRWATAKLSIYKNKIDTETGIMRYEAYKNIKSKRWDLIEVDNSWWALCVLSRKVCEDMRNNYWGYPFESTITKYYRTEEEQPTGMKYVEANMSKVNQYKPDVSDWGMKLYSRELWEDLLFFERAKQLWYKIYCDTKVHAYHIGKPVILEP